MQNTQTVLHDLALQVIPNLKNNVCTETNTIDYDNLLSDTLISVNSLTMGQLHETLAYINSVATSLFSDKELIH